MFPSHLGLPWGSKSWSGGILVMHPNHLNCLLSIIRAAGHLWGSPGLPRSLTYHKAQLLSLFPPPALRPYSFTHYPQDMTTAEDSDIDLPEKRAFAKNYCTLSLHHQWLIQWLWYCPICSLIQSLMNKMSKYLQISTRDKIVLLKG